MTNPETWHEDGHKLTMVVHNGVLRPKAVCPTPKGRADCHKSQVGCIVEYTVWHEGEEEIFGKNTKIESLVSLPADLMWMNGPAGIELRILDRGFPVSTDSIPAMSGKPTENCSVPHRPILTPDLVPVRQFLAFFGSMEDQVSVEAAATILGYDSISELYADADVWLEGRKSK